jgi:folate-binding protein YgfZ
MGSKVYRRTERDWIRVHGADRQRFLQGLWTLDLNRLQAGSVGSGILLTNKGKVVAPAMFLNPGSELILSLPKSCGEPVVQHMDRYLVADDVNLELVPSIFDVYECLGVDKLAQPIPASVPEARDKIFQAEMPWVPRLAVGPTHWEFWASPGSNTASTLTESFAELSDSDWDAQRIEAGVPAWGVDYNSDSLALEFPFVQEISFHKGCYLGQEVIAMGTYRGRPARYFCHFQASAPLQPGWVHSTEDPDRPVGKVTSAIGSQGLGLLRLQFLKKPLVLKTPDGDLPLHEPRVLDEFRVGGPLGSG